MNKFDTGQPIDRGTAYTISEHQEVAYCRLLDCWGDPIIINTQPNIIGFRPSVGASFGVNPTPGNAEAGNSELWC